MGTNSNRKKGRDGTLSVLNVAIEALNLAKEIASATPAKAVFGSVSVLLSIIRDSMVNDQDYVELGLSCADICRALDRGMKGKRLNDLSRSVREAINQLATTVAEIHGNVTKHSQRNPVSRFLHARNDKDTIAAWRAELNRILHVFNTELTLNTNITVSDIRDDVSVIRQEIGGRVRPAGKRKMHSVVQTQISTLGESPPSAPRACFGRDGLIEKIIGLAETLTPIALIGTGGIGKTSIALTVLHHDRIKERFGDNRRFIRCDQFPASCANFLRRLSRVIGAGVENPEDLTPLRPRLTSKEMLIVLDNAESILDLQRAGGREINAVVEELSQIDNVCLCITSRITTVPPDCETLEIPTLSMEAARDAFYRIYKYGGRSDPVNNILEQLDFHPLSVTLLATVAHQNMWDEKRLTREWKQRQTGVLQTGRDRSLASTIELSLTSPMFQNLGPDAPGLLKVVAFFPQGIDENNLDWLFPDISNRTTIFDVFCNLSLTYRNDGFITMLAPLRDYLRPQDPTSSPLLCATKNRYFMRMSIEFDRNGPAFRESRWIVSEDVNVEHLIDEFASVDTNSHEVWEACSNFVTHLRWHKPRHTTLRQKIEDLPDDHWSKPGCLLELSKLFRPVGNYTEQKQLLGYALKLVRQRGEDHLVAQVLRELSDANRILGLCGEGIQQAREALEIYQRLGTTTEQARCLSYLALSLREDKQLDAAEEAASHAIDLLPLKGQEFLICDSQCLLGNIHRLKGEGEKAIHCFEAALAIASPFNWHDLLFLIHHSLAALFLDEREYDKAHTHVEQAKSHAVDHTYYLGIAMDLHARIWYGQRRFEEAKYEALCAFETYEKLGAARDIDACRALLKIIDRAIQKQAAADYSDSSVPNTPSSAFPPSPFSRFFKHKYK